MPKHEVKGFEDIQAQLKREHSDLQDHIASVLERIVMDRPDDPVAVFEEVSHFVKNNKFDAPADKTVDNLKELQKTDEALEKLREWLLPKVNEDGTEAEPVTLPQVPNVAHLSSFLQWGGVNIGEETSHILQKSMVTFQTQQKDKGNEIKKIRLVGKILGSSRDQWVIEVEGIGGEEVEGIEPRDTQLSCNRQTQWVSTNLLKDWSMLPDVTPALLQTSRQIKHIFTGDLNAKVTTNPHFDGSEQHLLRCQIARINHGTFLVPMELMKPAEGEEGDMVNVEPNAEDGWKPKPNEEVASADKWTYYLPNILQRGMVKCAKYEEELDDENPEKAYWEEQKVNDPYIGRLKPLNEDTDCKEEVEGGEPKAKWKVTVEGGKEKFQLAPEVAAFNPEGSGETTQGYVVIKSERWPGAVTVYQNGVFQSFYLGYGLKAGVDAFQPIVPPDVMDDPVDRDDQEEPQPNKDEPQANEGDQENQE